MNVLAFTGGKCVPSARFRVRQYVEALSKHGITLDECPAWFGQYPPKSGVLRPFWITAALTERSLQAIMRRHYDVVLFQREMISTLLTAERFCTRPRVLDIDDAIWVHRRGVFAGRLASMCDAIVCGNTYLAEYCSEFCSNIYVVATAVDTIRFHPIGVRNEGPPIIGWSGMSPNLVELERIEPALAKVLHHFPDSKLRVICDQHPRFREVPSEQVEFVRWSPDIEVSALQDLSVGLMPLSDSEWARGKCAFKMLTYMACGVPAVVSPIGMNVEVLALGEAGYTARSESDWVGAISTLLADPELAMRVGITGRCIVESTFSVDALAPEYARILRATV